MLVSATWPGEARLQVVVLPSDADGIRVRDDWDNMGQRQTDSGSVSFSNVVCDAKAFLGPPGAGGIVWATLRPCVTQSILSNIFVGLAQGALSEAREYTRGLEKPFAVSSGTRPAEDPYVLEHYGEMYVQVAAAEGLLDQAADALQTAWEREYAL